MRLRTKLFLLSCGLIALFGLMLRLPSSLAGGAAQDQPTLTEEQKKLVTATRDAVRNADIAILAAEELRRTADTKVTLITNIVPFSAADENAMRKMEESAGHIRAIASLNLLS